MSLTFLSPPRISSALFARILQKGTSAGPSPCAPIAFACYDIIAAAGLDPACLLAIFAKESQYGCTGIAPTTRNWGNVRTAARPELASNPGGPGSFASYPTWQNGLKDLCIRLNERYIAKGLTTPESIFPVYAPSSENDTAGYIAFVHSHVAQWQAEDQPVTQTTGYADHDMLLDLGANRPGTKLTGFHAFTCHETGNEAPTATAQMHRRYWNTGGSGRWVSSVHFVTDETEALQLIPIDEIGWHIGDGADEPLTDEAFFTVAGEICVNSKAGFVSAATRMAKIAAKILRAKGVAPIDGVTLRKHGSYPATTHTHCPAHLNAGDWGMTWAEWVQLVVQNYGGVIQPHPKFTYYTTTTDSFVRQGPSRKFPTVLLLPTGTRAGYDGETQGEDIGGNAVWRHRADGLGFTHSSLLVAS